MKVSAVREKIQENLKAWNRLSDEGYSLQCFSADLDDETMRAIIELCDGVEHERGDVDL